MLKRTRKPKTFKQMLVGAVMVPAMFFGAFIGTSAALEAAMDSGLLPHEMQWAAPAEAEAPAPAKPSKAERLVERHGCWTGEAPADMTGVLPGHVVVTEPGKGTRLAGPVLVGKALEQIFEDADHGLQVHAFCH